MHDFKGNKILIRGLVIDFSPFICLDTSLQKHIYHD
jgi:hypothetical protein